ncbi:hypothetical protein SAMN05661091_2174 [Paenibacillus uliginis N3/975]|uniref:Uncharacterized protein n=1 Tax=Paenibacillus uliginis N3/975 TaxID=1313296 RepID=A0A1X7HBH3_9BACL|nr:hypothetical protein [Paenibacillus uliginis]SMF82391.1 hypothetical protein SAMN05661091_2174 [Paenibacillus uliginis N3/975]
MAFGISKQELKEWKTAVSRGEIAYLTHYWYDSRFPEYKTVTKVGCSDLVRLRQWCMEHDLDPIYIHNRMPYPHFDLIGPKQAEILRKASLDSHVRRFNL